MGWDEFGLVFWFLGYGSVDMDADMERWDMEGSGYGEMGYGVENQFCSLMAWLFLVWRVFSRFVFLWAWNPAPV